MTFGLIRAFKLCVYTSLLFALPAAHANSDLKLPSLGDASAGLISPAEEYELGQTLLRYYRASMRTSDDPFIEEYLGQLLRRIATYSDLQDKRLDLLVLENPSLNAFAAPGGIVGVNTGTFLIAEQEQQLASIIAHELAHLSQRHYARRVQQQQTTSMISLAALLAGIMVAASSDSNTGIAALPAIQAAAIESSLRFSRQMEQEADRIGMETLIGAGFDPYAMPDMFELMLRASRYRSNVPEFLLTHPVTEKRISDSMGRASRYPKRQYARDIGFQLVRARVILNHENSPQVAVKRFQDELNGNKLSPVAARYGLMMAYTKTGQVDKAQESLNQLRIDVDDPVILAIAQADIYARQEHYNDALDTLAKVLQNYPNSHPLNVRYAELLMAAGKYQTCESVLLEHVKRKPNNAYVWYLLAEVHGLAGHIFDVHKARAEYFILNGIYNKAEIQLRNALRLVDKDDFQAKAKIEQRLLDVKKLIASRPF